MFIGVINSYPLCQVSSRNAFLLPLLQPSCWSFYDAYLKRTHRPILRNLNLMPARGPPAVAHTGLFSQLGTLCDTARTEKLRKMSFDTKIVVLEVHNRYYIMASIDTARSPIATGDRRSILYVVQFLSSLMISLKQNSRTLI